MAQVLLTSSVYSAPGEDNVLERERLQYGKEYIVTGKINDVSGVGEVTVKPDIIITNFELMTEADTLEKASEENAKSMNELKKYLLSIGVKENDIETSRYSKGEKVEAKFKDEKSNIYKTTFQVIITMENDKFYSVTDVLNKENITELKNVNSDYRKNFYFVIESFDKNIETSRKLAKEKYDRIESALKKLGVQEVSIFNYNVQETKETEKKKTYTITHAFKVKMKSSVDMGKLLKKCETLRIKNPGSMVYDISEELRTKTTMEAYEKAMNNLYEKAKIIIKNRGYELGDVTIWDRTQNGGDYIPFPAPAVMMNQRSINASYFVNEEAMESTDIPFSTAQEMKITARISASFDIIPLHLRLFAPLDCDRRFDSPALSGRRSRPSWRTSCRWGQGACLGSARSKAPTQPPLPT